VLLRGWANIFSESPILTLFFNNSTSLCALTGVFSVNLSALLGHSHEAAPSETE